MENTDQNNNNNTSSNLLWQKLREPFETDKTGIILRLLLILFCLLSFLLPWIPSGLNFTAQLALSRDGATMSWTIPGMITILNVGLLLLVLSPDDYTKLNLIGLTVSAIFMIVTPVYYGFVLEANWPAMYVKDQNVGSSAGVKCSYLAGVMSIACIAWIFHKK